MPGKTVVSKAIPLVTAVDVKEERYPNENAPKRVKGDGQSRKESIRRSDFYEPYRALGYVATDVPIAIQAMGQAFFITTSVGSTFQVYDAEHLQLKMVGDMIAADERITCLTVLGERTYAGTSLGKIYVFKRNRHILTLGLLNRGPQSPTVQLLSFGEQVMALFEDNTLAVWPAYPSSAKAKNAFDIITPLRHKQLKSGPLRATFIMHPPTYVNKIMVGYSNGALEICNILKMSHEASVKQAREADGGHTKHRVTFISPSPVLDVVAVGYSDGHVSVHNIAVDECIMSFKCTGQVKGVSFSSFSSTLSLLAVANDLGDIIVWDLDKRQVHSELLSAHTGPISSLQFLNQQSLLVSASLDNSLKEWYFDTPDMPPRLLRFRSGHSAPPNRVRFHDDSGLSVISSGQDKTLRYTSLVRDAQSTAFSHGQGLEKKAKQWHRESVLELLPPPITDFAVCDAKRKQWDNVLTGHLHDSTVRTWSLQRKAIGKHKLATLPLSSVENVPKHKLTKEGLPSFAPSPASSSYRQPTGLGIVRAGEALPAVKCVGISKCGNFGLLGTFDGRVEVYNMQSGLHKRSCVSGYGKPITGVASDTTSRYIYACGLEGCLLVFSLSSGALLHRVELGSAATRLELAPAGVELAAVSCDDFGVRVIDLDALRVVRDFEGPRGAVTDFCFSPDARHLVVASMDSAIRTFDIACSRLIDLMRVPSLPTSIAFSPRGEYLATTHVGQLGIYLWLNKSIYSMDLSHFGRVISPEEEDSIIGGTTAETGNMNSLPFMLVQRDDASADSDASDSEGVDFVENDAVTSSGIKLRAQSEAYIMNQDQLNESLVTLCEGNQRHRWSSLLALDLIRARNKPLEPPKAPEKAPFFLQTLPGVSSKFIASPVDKTEKVEKRLSSSSSQGFKLLQTCSAKGDYGDYISYMVNLAPAAIDVELRSLIPVFTGEEADVSSLVWYLLAINWALERKRQFDAAEALLTAFFRVHHEVILLNVDKSVELNSTLQLLETNHNAAWSSLENVFRKSLSFIDFLRNHV